MKNSASDLAITTDFTTAGTQERTTLKIESVPKAEFPVLEGKPNARGKRFAVVVARFNAFITERLLQSACDGLLRSGALREHIAIVRVPGAFEIPSAARTLALTGKYDAIICLGCLLRGDTAHYDVIVNEVTRGIGQSAQETGVPHAFGVLTCENLQQAIDRAGLKMGNKGFEAALAAVEMASLTSAIRLPASGSRTADLGRHQIPRFARNDKSKSQNAEVRSQNAEVRSQNDKMRGQNKSRSRNGKSGKKSKTTRAK